MRPADAAPDSRQARAERILDTAAELLVRWGYRRLTMDDVAEAAGIGKGTIYLHWKTREALFSAVMQRELTALLQALADAVRTDPENVLPHNLARQYYLNITRRPLLRGLFIGDATLLGKLVRSAREHASSVDAQRVELVRHLAAHGLVRSDLPPEEIAYSFRTLIVGFLLADPWLVGSDQPSLERRAELLAMTVRVFERDRRPTADQLRTLQRVVLDLFDEVSFIGFNLAIDDAD
jgi:AcrR family transcriptional regulator